MLNAGCDGRAVGQHGPLAAGADDQGPGAGQLIEAQAGSYAAGRHRYHTKAEVGPPADVEPDLNPVEWEAGAGQVGGMLVEHPDKLGPPATDDERPPAQVNAWRGQYLYRQAGNHFELVDFLKLCLLDIAQKSPT